MSEEKFSQYCIVELFGRQVIAGLVTEQVIGGSTFVRVDVPSVDGLPAFSRFYGNGAIYCMTPVSREAAIEAIRYSRPDPINVYIPVLRARNIPIVENEDNEDESIF